MMSERTKRMIDGFMKHYEAGKTIPEIAKLYGLSNDTLYRYLDEIAKSNGFISRDDLLQEIHHTPSLCGYEKPIAVLDIDEFNEKFDSAIKSIKSTIEKIDSIIEREVF